MDYLLHGSIAIAALTAFFLLRKKANKAKENPFQGTNTLLLLGMGVLASAYFSSIREIIERDGLINQRSLFLSLAIGMGIYFTIYAVIRLIRRSQQFNIK